jgi:hypothetical protein|tara:strand:- start:3324 stop:5387 length:2064 start_codon:yes stop_codon:yes gene_type:complete
LAYIDEAETEAGVGMSESDLQAAVGGYISDAIQYIDDDISPTRAESTKYYRGDPFGNEVDGRSQVVSRDVRDSVQAVLPSMMRVFFGSEKVVEFVPRNANDLGMAEQATDYLNYIIKQDNDAIGTFYSVFKDALMNKGGFVKWWWDDSTEVQTHSFEGLDEGALGLILQEEGVEAVSVEGRPAPGISPEQLQQMEAQGQTAPQVYDVEIKRSRKRNQVKIETMPPEEFFVDAAATSLDDAMVVGHRTMSTVSSLVALGYDRDMLDEHLSDEFAFIDSDEYSARYSNTDMPGPVSAYERKRVLYVEAWCYIDYDGDGISELRRICTVGNNYKVVNNEPADSIPFAMFACDPEPHVFFGSDIADLTKDIQRVKSAVLRGMLDSLSFALYPRTGVVEGMVNIDDVMNPEVGSIIRMRQPNMVQQLDVPFLGKDAFPMIQYLDSMKESRTGQTAASQGLDPDVLQSTTKAAVTATIRGAEQHLELMARLFADSFKRMFKGVLKLVITHQDRERIVRLRDEWVPIDPRVWDSTMDCSVNVGLGVGTTDERLGVLNQIAMRQQEALEKLGPNNPLVGLGQIRNTLSKMLEISGYPDSNQFFKQVPLDYEPPPPEPPKLSPEELLAQAQMADIQARTAIDEQKIQLAAMKQQQLDERESARIAGDLAIREFQAESKFENDVDLELVKASLKEGL